MKKVGIVELLTILFLEKVIPSVALCGNINEVCHIEEGTIVGIVVCCMVAVLLIGAVLLLTCSHLRMSESDDISIDDRTITDVVPQPPNYSPYNDNWSNHSQLDTHRHSGNVRSSTTVTVDNTVEQSYAFSTSIHITQDGQEGREI